MLPYKEKAALQSQVLVRNASCMGTTGVRRSFLVSLYLLTLIFSGDGIQCVE